MKRAIGIGLATLALAACAPPEIGTVGAVFGRDNDTNELFVREAPSGRAAYAAGLRPGDEILMIDGVYVRDLPAEAIRARLHGEVGTKVMLTVARGDRILRLEVKRASRTERVAAPTKEERIQE